MPLASISALDCNGNGVDDEQDLAATSQDCNENSIPDECEVVPVQLALGATPLDVPALPRLVKTFDVDGDGDLDLVQGSRNEGTSTLTVFLNDGERRFRTSAEFTLDGLLYDLAWSDMDGDEVIDLVATTSDTIFIFVAARDGTLDEPLPLPRSTPGQRIVAHDVTGDGVVDLILDDRSGASLAILPFHDDGTFDPSYLVETGEGPRAILAADLDGDGDGDLASANRASEDISLLFNDGTGAFTMNGRLSLGGMFPFALEVRDLDGDNTPDLVAASGTAIAVFLSQGEAGYTAGVSHPALGATSLAVVDLNGDGAPDLAYAAAEQVLVRINDGAGGFAFLQETTTLSNTPTSLAAGDFDGDGRVDLAATTLQPAAIQFLWGGENAAFRVSLETVSLRECDNEANSGCEPHAGAIADFDGDGDLDVVAVVPRPSLLVVALNEGGRLVYSPAQDHPFGGNFPLAAVSADMDGDGHVDVVTNDNNQRFVHVHSGRGDGTFESREITNAPGAFSVDVTDLDGDGNLDILTANSGEGLVSYILSANDTFPRGFRMNQSLFTRSPHGITGRDFDGDGDTDLAIAAADDSRVVLFLNDGSQEFSEGDTYTLLAEPRFILAADFDDDGDDDLATANTFGNSVSVLLNRGNGTFRGATDYAVSDPPYSVVATDLDGDSFLDLATANENQSTVSILTGLRDGTFSPPQKVPSGVSLRYVLPGDLDDDGDTDLVTVDRGGRTLTVLRNVSARTADTPDFLVSVCTALDFQHLARPIGASSDADRGVKFALPASPQALLQQTVFQNTQRFPLHQEFLAEVFPNLFPGLELQTWESLIGVRSSRQYFAGTVSRFPTADGFVYGMALLGIDWRNPTEVLRPEEVRGVLEELRLSFRLGPLAFFPQDPNAEEVAASWDDPGFDILFDSGGSVVYEPYTRAVGFGNVRILDEDSFEDANDNGQISFRDILVLSFAPRDIEGVVGGVITARPQGELSHVAVRTSRRGTPNAFAKDALERFEAFDGKLVRLEVKDTSYTVTTATPEEAEEFWANNRPTLSTLPTVDPDFSELPSFDEISALDATASRLPQEARFGGKATNLARLQATLAAPGFEQYREVGFAIPAHYYLEFLKTNRLPSALDAATLLSYEEYILELATHERFESDQRLRFEALEALRDHMRNESAIDPDLVARLGARIREIFPTPLGRVRFRSSSNVEDAVEFSGAGLYDSTSVCAEDDLDGDAEGPSLCDSEKSNERGVPRGLRKVWASLWNFGAFEERAFYGIQQNLSAMGILVNRAFVDEQVNGVAFTGDPSNAFDRRYVVTAQIGEESVVSPEPGVRAEKSLLEVRDGEVVDILRAVPSTLAPPGTVVLSDEQLRELGALLWHIDQNFPLDTGIHARRDVLVDIEFKIEASGELAVKQVRPFLLPDPGPPPPTFALVIPDGTSACGHFNISRDPRTEFEGKSRLRLRAGTVALPAGAGAFPADLVEELVVGPDQEIATRLDTGTFRVERIRGDGRIVNRFRYTQPFLLADGGLITLELSQLDFEERDGRAVEAFLRLDDVALTEDLTFRSTIASEETQQVIEYTGCTHEHLPRWEIEAMLSDGNRIIFEERYREEVQKNWGPASLARAEVTLGESRRSVTSYWELVYSAARHNLNVVYWVVLDPAVEVAGISAPVHFVEVHGPNATGTPPPFARYLGAAFEPLGTVEVAYQRGPPIQPSPPQFHRGDVDDNGVLDITDAIVLLEHLFSRRPSPRCPKAADANDDGRLNVLDSLELLSHVAGAVVELPEPVVCGTDPTRDELSCASQSACN